MENDKTGKRNKRLIIASVALLLLSISVTGSQVVQMAEINGNIDAGTSQYVKRVIRDAQAQNSDLVLIEVNSMSGLDKATKEIVNEIINSKIKVAVYAPRKFGGAFASSVYLMMSADIAAVDPQAYIGQSEPLPLDNRTITPYEGYMVSLASSRGRNVNSARDFVTKNSYLSGREAEERKVIDYSPENLQALLKDLNLQNANIKISTPSITEQVYSFFSNPQIISLFFLAGCLLSVYVGKEGYGAKNTPARIRYYILALIPLSFFIITLWGLENIRFSPLRILLIIFGAVLVSAETLHSRPSIFGVAGGLSAGIGIASAGAEPYLASDLETTLGVLMTAGALIVLSVTIANAISKKDLERRKAMSEALIGVKARVVEELRPNGIIKIEGKLRQAYSVGEEKIEMGSAVQVVKVQGRVLNVMREGGPKKPQGHGAHGGHGGHDEEDKGHPGHGGHDNHDEKGSDRSSNRNHALHENHEKEDPDIISDHSKSHDKRSHSPSAHDDQSHHFTGGPDKNFFVHDHQGTLENKTHTLEHEKKECSPEDLKEKVHKKEHSEDQ